MLRFLMRITKKKKSHGNKFINFHPLLPLISLQKYSGLRTD